MSFVIEVPGEAAPLSLPDLCKALQAGTSNDTAQRQAASKQLEAWQSYPDFFSGLQSVFLDQSLPYQVRFLAIIFLKNGIDRFWRSSPHVKNGLSADEKARIRARLFQGTVDEADRTLALHNALATAKIVRIDYPQEWPGALSDLLALLRRIQEAQDTQGASAAQLHGVLVVVLRVVKELGTARLRRSQTALQHVAEELFYVLANVYAANTTQWSTFLRGGGGSGDTDAVDRAMANSLVALKVLRHLVTSGFEFPHRSKLVVEFWTLSQTQFDEFFDYVRRGSTVPATYQDAVGRHLLKFTKLHMEMCEAHPASFAALPNCVSLVRAYWGLVASFAEMYTESGGLRQTTGDGGGGGGGGSSAAKLDGPLLERLALRALLLLKSCIQMVTQPLQTFRYRSEEAQQERDAGIQLVRNELFTNTFLLEVVEVIITKLFLFRPSDLEAWEENPEDWEAQETDAGAAWEWQVRPCAERVFLSLLIHYKNVLAPPLLSYFQNAKAADADVLRKEAVYTAMCNAAVAIDKAFDFGDFLHTTLVKDAQAQGPTAKILRRRIAILLGSWHFYELPEASLSLTYSLYAHLLNKSDPANDEVVRLTAARQLKATVDDFQFRAVLFEPYAAGVFAALVDLLQEAEADETKLAVLGTMRNFIERMETIAGQFSDGVVAALPAIWDAAGPESYMIQQAVLSILATLMMALGAASAKYHALVLPLIADAMNPGSPVHQFLFEEAVELWSSVLHQSTAPLAAELTDLLPMTVHILEYDSHMVQTCLAILDAYVVLAPAAALSERFRRPMLAGLGGAMESKRWEQAKAAAGVVRRMVSAAQRLGGAEGVSVVARDLLATGLLPRVLERLHGAWAAQQTTGPKAKRSGLSTTAGAEYVLLLSELALADPRVLVELLLEVAAAGSHSDGGGDLASVWPWLADEWFGRLDSIASPEHQKLVCLGLTRLWELPSPVQELVLGRLQDYIALWTSAVLDAQGDATKPDCFVWDAPPGPSAYETPLMAAESAFAAKDAVHTETTYAFVMLRLQDMAARLGGEAAFNENWLVNVDQDVLAGFQRLAVPAPPGED